MTPGAKIVALLWMIAPSLLLAQQAPLTPVVPLEQRISHADPSKYRNMKAVHDGPGALDYRPLFDATSLETNLFFMHRGVIEPKSGIGAHFHINARKCSSSWTAKPSSRLMVALPP
jgi:hypothetical protein